MDDGKWFDDYGVVDHRPKGAGRMRELLGDNDRDECIIRNAIIEECARKLEWLVVEGCTINEAIPAIRALKERPTPCP